MTIFTTPALSAVDEAYRWLRGEVTQFPWDQEGQLSENQLAKSSSFSRTPIREALLRLEADGLVRRLPHRGVVVPPLQQADIDALLEVREVIEVWAARKVGRSARSLSALWKLIEEQESHTEDPADFIQLDIEFHNSIIRMTDNTVFMNLYEAHRFKQLRLGIKAVDHPGRIEEVIREHKEILETIEGADEQEIENTVMRHLGKTKNVIDSSH